jgi:hypothetical protein
VCKKTVTHIAAFVLCPRPGLENNSTTLRQTILDGFSRILFHHLTHIVECKKFLLLLLFKPRQIVSGDTEPAEEAVEKAVDTLREAAATQSVPSKRVFWALRQLEKAKLAV